MHNSFSCSELRSPEEKPIVFLPSHCGNAGNSTSSSQPRQSLSLSAPQINCLLYSFDEIFPLNSLILPLPCGDSTLCFPSWPNQHRTLELRSYHVRCQRWQHIYYTEGLRRSLEFGWKLNSPVESFEYDKMMMCQFLPSNSKASRHNP